VSNTDAGINLTATISCSYQKNGELSNILVLEDNPDNVIMGPLSFYKLSQKNVLELLRIQVKSTFLNKNEVSTE
jgi:hypothetical protein